jgi:pyruvate dehydrogenase E2 component (dihydrolipoamide acetyltransferase)
MADHVLMPKQGNTVESCIIVEWNVAVGDSVAVGDVLCSAETDKSTIEVESTAAGVVLALLYQEGDDVPVMLPIAIIGEKGEHFELPESAAPAAQEPAVEATPPAAPATPAAVVETQVFSHDGSSPRARTRAESLGVPISILTGSGPKGRVIERDVLSAVGQPLSPVAKESARELGVIPPHSGSGIGGRVLSSDLVRKTAVEPTALFTDYPLTGIRKITAQRMMESIATTSQYTLTGWADARALKRLRAGFKAARPELGLGSITIGDLILWATAKTLVEYPTLNAHFLGDSIRHFHRVDLGVATDTPRGLLVPVLRGSDSLSLKELSDATKVLVSSAREGKAQPDDLSGSTFTVSNVGSFGIEGFTPVLNIPEVAILGVGTITLRPTEDEDGDVLFIDHISLSLTADHQAVDGAEAARFLRTLSENIASIDLLLAL